MSNESEKDLEIKKDDDLQIPDLDSDNTDKAAAETGAASSIEADNPEPEQPENKIENDTSDNSSEEIEIISAETVPDDSDNNVLEPDNRKYHITTGDIIRYVILAISIGVFIYAASRLVPKLISYKREAENNKQVEEEVVSKSDEPVTTDEDDFKGVIPSIVVDFDKLLEINSDSVGWLEIPSLGISYPIVQGPDNDFYLQHDINKNFAWSGAIYLDYRCSRELDEAHATIYGHHMNDGSMFAALLMYDNEDFFKKNQEKNNNYVYIYLKDTIKIYQMFAVVDTFFETDPDSFIVSLYTEESKQNYLDHIKEKQLYDTGITATKNDTLLTLYTCQADSSSKERHMIHTKLIKEIPR